MFKQSNSVIDAMIAEFGIYKTAQAIQALFDADLLNESEADAMLEALNAHRYKLARYSNEQFTPVALR